MDAAYTVVKTAEGYDVVAPATGLVVGELERTATAYAKPAWTGKVVINGGRGWDGPSLYHPVFRSYHGECTIRRMADRLWREARGYVRALQKRTAVATSPGPVR